VRKFISLKLFSIFQFFLILGDNKIKFLNGEAFADLKKLKYLYLLGNVCINEEFSNSSRVAVLQQTLNEKCGFYEPKAPKTVVISMAIGGFVLIFSIVAFISWKFCCKKGPSKSF
jgi:hypothetical protein